MNNFASTIQRSVPERLIYKQPVVRIVYEDVVTAADFNSHEYRMCDTKTGRYLGRMIAGPMVCRKNIRKSFYPINDDYKSFFIDELHSYYSNENIGTTFINLAKNESKNEGCHGRIHLVASSIFNPYRPPHVFYRKLGFNSNNSKVNKYLDKCIKHKKNVHWLKVGELCMYLQIGKNLPQEHIVNWNAIKKFFKHLL